MKAEFVRKLAVPAEVKELCPLTGMDYFQDMSKDSNKK